MRSSMESELLIGLQRQYNFRANLIDSNGSWGILVNGVWSGVIGQVYYGVSGQNGCSWWIIIFILIENGLWPL